MPEEDRKGRQHSQVWLEAFQEVGGERLEQRHALQQRGFVVLILRPRGSEKAVESQ